MNETGVTRQYEDLIGKYQTLPFMNSPSLDINNYVVGQALNDLFFMLGEEEKKIRKNPAARVTSTHNYTGTIADHLTLWGGLLENTFSVTRFDARVWGRGDQDLNVTPAGNYGSYFSQQGRDALRFGGSPSYTLPPLNRWGTHSFKIGAYFAAVSWRSLPLAPCPRDRFATPEK